ncbi:MAG: hypothetical protein AAF318_04955 [Pseudomonadota bacterium]
MTISTLMSSTPKAATGRLKKVCQRHLDGFVGNVGIVAIVGAR